MQPLLVGMQTDVEYLIGGGGGGGGCYVKVVVEVVQVGIEMDSNTNLSHPGPATMEL